MVILFEKNKWYYLVIIYDVIGLVIIYINGEKDVMLQIKGGLVNIDGMYIIISGIWFRDNCMMVQLCLWKKVVSQIQIKVNMYLGVNFVSFDLIGYWRLDEGEGNFLKDCIFNYYDMIVKGILEWRYDIKFKQLFY